VDNNCCPENELLHGDRIISAERRNWVGSHEAEPDKKYREINAFFELPFVDGFACFAAHTLVIITHTRAF
jgi:hypothetical protein